MLKGTRLRENADKYSIVYRSKPPYQILYNKYITYSELLCSFRYSPIIGQITIIPGRFNLSLAHLGKSFNRPFEMYLSFYYYCKERDIFRNKNSLKTRYDILYDFALSLGVDAKLFSDIVKFDFMLTSGKGALPDCIDMIEDRRFLKRLRSIYTTKMDQIQIASSLRPIKQ